MNLSNYLEKGYSYSDYLTKVEKTFQELEESGDEKGFAQYYSMNLKRIDRLNNTFELSEAQKEQLKSVNTNFSLLVISEAGVATRRKVCRLSTKSCKNWV